MSPGRWESQIISIKAIFWNSFPPRCWASHLFFKTATLRHSHLNLANRIVKRIANFMCLLCVKVGVDGPSHSLQYKQVHSTSGHLLSEGVVHPAIIHDVVVDLNPDSSIALWPTSVNSSVSITWPDRGKDFLVRYLEPPIFPPPTQRRLPGWSGLPGERLLLWIQVHSEHFSNLAKNIGELCIGDIIQDRSWVCTKQHGGASS